MKSVAEEINAKCPIIADEYTRLDSITVPAYKIFNYNYSLIDVEKDEVDLDTVQKYIEPSIIEGVKHNPEMKVVRSQNVTFVYSYYDIHGELVYELTVTPEMYH